MKLYCFLAEINFYAFAHQSEPAANDVTSSPPIVVDIKVKEPDATEESKEDAPKEEDKGEEELAERPGN